MLQTERNKTEKQWLDEFRLLAQNDDVAEFYRRYAEYSEWSKVARKSRQAIHKMALRAAELLSEQTKGG